jgi:hypothetical protein
LGLGNGMKTWRGRVWIEEILHGGWGVKTWAEEGGEKTEFGKSNEDMAREGTC